MLSQILQAMPPEAASGLWLLALVGVLVGMLLWLAGSRFSRPLTSVVGVCIGGFIGLRLPGWFALGIPEWSSAVAVALVLGTFGFLFHRLWVGAGLGGVAALWACYAVIVSYPGQAISIPVAAAPMNLVAYLMEVGRGICPELHRTLPLTAGTAAIGGLVLTLLLPRVAMYLFYSLLGVTFLCVLGPTAMQQLRPEMLAVLPTRAMAQSLLVLGMVVFGAVVQWRTAPQLNLEADPVTPAE